ncbi:MAG: hypothetical protein E7L01_10870 [Paenibacillus macerans]|uniref:Uncharacterized protein n=2 Tax=Paenibacillus macerans TaxID=44252 RepID=A0A6N8F406_PAEMA|nr:hypothetical protein [Paenibacillus macerans]MBS5913817.1 hypothetical protein [Paenibacillus macerans]MCY7560232.1 hypothetical protein [Paenibacillus macerans]MDU5948859.1 hypothetical protein [Paenibacillus macerans]MDU7473825.1 hypothetical protein [Paenibacillus macerans]MEC0136453.1 hypothetical protein [Paenibacillus macerans]
MEFQVAFNRATGDEIISIAADEKGTIMVVYDYLNVTRDYGKSWVSYRIPTDEMYRIHYVNPTRLKTSNT